MGSGSVTLLLIYAFVLFINGKVALDLFGNPVGFYCKKHLIQPHKIPRLGTRRVPAHPGLLGCYSARDWRGAEQPRRGAAGLERESAEPRKARFPAEPEMRPN
jgi:hypothetical protein